MGRTAGAYAFLSAEGERSLLARARDGDESARGEIVLAHIRFAVAAAHKLEHSAIPFDDLVQEAVFGLLQAVDHFDVEHKVRFVTYAAWHVRNRLQQAVYRGQSAVHFPETAQHKALYYALGAARAKLAGKTQAQADAELAEVFGVDPRVIEELSLRLMGDSSLNETTWEGCEELELLVDERPGPEAVVEDAIDRPRVIARMEAAMATLTEREREVLCGRIYCEPEDQLTLEAIGERLGITRQRASKIEGEAVAKMRRALGPLAGYHFAEV